MTGGRGADPAACVAAYDSLTCADSQDGNRRGTLNGRSHGGGLHPRPARRIFQLSESKIPAWARMAVWVPIFSGSRLSGTITVTPTLFLSLRWLPLVDTDSNPFSSSSLIISSLDRRGLRGLKLPGQ